MKSTQQINLRDRILAKIQKAQQKVLMFQIYIMKFKIFAMTIKIFLKIGMMNYSV